MAGMTCDVCGRSPTLGVASSTLGAISFAFCQECCTKPAEPEFMFHFLYWDVGHAGEGIAEWVDEFSTWRDGKYITWQEFKTGVRDGSIPSEEPNYDDVVPPEEEDEDVSGSRSFGELFEEIGLPHVSDWNPVGLPGVR